MTAKAVIIDGYVDEPACLGVPPYISPYIRTTAGLLIEEGYQPVYLTIDRIRSDPNLLKIAAQADLTIMISGVSVPGTYLGGTPASFSDIRQIGDTLSGKETFLGGPIQHGYSGSGGKTADTFSDYGFKTLLSGSPASALEQWFLNSEPNASFSYQKEDRWAILGAEIIKQHPNFPYLICELETARGCSRSESGCCSFCTEIFYGAPTYRSQTGVADEVAALYGKGARHFRLGRQPDLLTWQAGRGEYPRPEPDSLRDLFRSIRDAAPDLKTLHIDNINPGTVARHPDASIEALKVIVNSHTPGDTAAIGMETADPDVIEANNLKATPDMVFESIRMINEVGSIRKDGIAELLPGLNFIIGLAGETPETYKLNQEFLKSLTEAHLLVKRVNIRQLMPFEGTRAWENNELPVNKRKFFRFKEWVRNSFDLPMLQKVYPIGTILKSIIIEKTDRTSFGRQLGSYPILVGFPSIITKGTLLDGMVVGYGPRSVTSLPYPIPINLISANAINWLPGVSRELKNKILVARPFSSGEDFSRASGIKMPEGSLSFTDHAVP